MTILERWREQSRASVPDACADLRIRGIALEELHRELSTTIGHVLEAGAIDHERHIVLGVCLDKLSTVLGSLEGTCGAHFVAWKLLALSVIEAYAEQER